MENQVQGGSISFGGLLAVLFITLKLTHVIDWSWWWVLAPLWLGVAVVLGVVAVIFLVMGIGMVVSGRRGRWVIRKVGK